MAWSLFQQAAARTRPCQANRQPRWTHPSALCFIQCLAGLQATSDSKATTRAKAAARNPHQIDPNRICILAMLASARFRSVHWACRRTITLAVSQQQQQLGPPGRPQSFAASSPTPRPSQNRALSQPASSAAIESIDLRSARGPPPAYHVIQLGDRRPGALGQELLEPALRFSEDDWESITDHEARQWLELDTVLASDFQDWIHLRGPAAVALDLMDSLSSNLRNPFPIYTRYARLYGASEDTAMIRSLFDMFRAELQRLGLTQAEPAAQPDGTSQDTQAHDIGLCFEAFMYAFTKTKSPGQMKRCSELLQSTGLSIPTGCLKWQMVASLERGRSHEANSIYNQIEERASTSPREASQARWEVLKHHWDSQTLPSSDITLALLSKETPGTVGIPADVLAMYLHNLTRTNHSKALLIAVDILKFLRSRKAHLTPFFLKTLTRIFLQNGQRASALQILRTIAATPSARRREPPSTQLDPGYLILWAATSILSSSAKVAGELLGVLEAKIAAGPSSPTNQGLRGGARRRKRPRSPPNDAHSQAITELSLSQRTDMLRLYTAMGDFARAEDILFSTHAAMTSLRSQLKTHESQSTAVTPTELPKSHNGASSRLSAVVSCHNLDDLRIQIHRHDEALQTMLEHMVVELGRDRRIEDIQALLRSASTEPLEIRVPKSVLSKLLQLFCSDLSLDAALSILRLLPSDSCNGDKESLNRVKIRDVLEIDCAHLKGQRWTRQDYMNIYHVYHELSLQSTRSSGKPSLYDKRLQTRFYHPHQPHAILMRQRLLPPSQFQSPYLAYQNRLRPFELDSVKRIFKQFLRDTSELAQQAPSVELYGGALSLYARFIDSETKTEHSQLAPQSGPEHHRDPHIRDLLCQACEWIFTEMQVEGFEPGLEDIQAMKWMYEQLGMGGRRELMEIWHEKAR
ncbi:uncharacterized protein BJ171DRAFT_252125 [Polychytrium aggregatum]|uniref:uncharacterized protein n=1 Tax=Polychytrium aggregatum TaxID=110093 RepID=UPI0022FE5DD6|nr:uncharacterized protein BJ171DRAFT_252125 [Polychytrium aggregatum]KAI9193611.1 hypothetical protein BJ171DRAFT_252125 [Polychytrium aggregatum]